MHSKTVAASAVVIARVVHWLLDAAKRTISYDVIARLPFLNDPSPHLNDDVIGEFRASSSVLLPTFLLTTLCSVRQK